MRCWTHGLPYVVLNAWDSIPGVERTGIHTWCWTHRHPYLVLNAQASIPGVKHMDFHMWCWTHGIPYMVLKYLGFHTWCWIKAWTLEPWILKLHSSNLPAFHTAIMNLPDELATTVWAVFNYSWPFQQSIGWALYSMYKYGAMYFYIEKVNNISDCIYGATPETLDPHTMQQTDPKLCTHWSNSKISISNSKVSPFIAAHCIVLKYR